VVDAADEDTVARLALSARAMRGLARFTGRIGLVRARRTAGGPIGKADVGSRGIVVRQLLDALVPERREAFVATQLLGMSYAQAAAVCGCPVQTIRLRVAQARCDLVHAHRQGGAPPSLDTGGTVPAQPRRLARARKAL
jgi:hypothetical protein